MVHLCPGMRSAGAGASGKGQVEQRTTAVLGELGLNGSYRQGSSAAKRSRSATANSSKRYARLADRAAGSSRHIVPDAVGVIVVNATFQVADAILLLAVLSGLGLGLPPPAASWGGILSDGLNYLYDGYWWLIWPARLAIVVTVVSFNFSGDALRDTLDIRLRSR
jgi:binding-protein-dependent transport system inner membrane component